jgi:hypothetical protein
MPRCALFWGSRFQHAGAQAALLDLSYPRYSMVLRVVTVLII